MTIGDRSGHKGLRLCLLTQEFLPTQQHKGNLGQRREVVTPDVISVLASWIRAHAGGKSFPLSRPRGCFKSLLPLTTGPHNHGTAASTLISALVLSFSFFHLSEQMNFLSGHESNLLPPENSNFFPYKQTAVMAPFRNKKPRTTHSSSSGFTPDHNLQNKKLFCC